MPQVVGAMLLPNLGAIASTVFYMKDGCNGSCRLFNESWSPLPEKVRGVVWVGSHASLGYASYLIFKEYGFCDTTKIPFAVYGANLLLNWGFPPLLRNSKDPKLAIVDLALAAGTGATVAHIFYALNPKAGYFCIPYILSTVYFCYRLCSLRNRRAVN